MKIAVDKYSYQVAINDGNKYIYLFDEDESLEDLMKTRLCCLNYKECDFVDINVSRFDIDCIKKTNINEKDWFLVPEMINNKIGVIIPNCNYGDIISNCFDSLLNQTYTNFEIIYVDDVSTDNSIEVAEDYQKRFKKIGVELKIVPLKQKRYNGGARNEAYLHLSEDVDYVYYIDSDDWLSTDTAFYDINLKLQRKPDVLFVGMSDYRGGVERLYTIPQYKDKYDAIQGWSGSCGKVIKKSLATRQECLYNEGTLKEDKNQHCKICIYMKSFALLKKPIYVWNRTNYKSVTTVRDSVIWGTSTIRHYADTLQLALSVKGMDERIDEILEERVMKTKKEMELGGDKQY